MNDNNTNIGISSLNKSPKKEGIYERVIIDKLAIFFNKKGYQILKHASLNVAWGSVLSEIDILGTKKNKIIAVEVKSKKDKLQHARTQIEKIKYFIDYCYVASDTSFNSKIFDDEIGIMLVSKNVYIIKKATPLKENVTKDALLNLKKKCLLKLVGDKKYRREKKETLVKMIFTKYCTTELNNFVRMIVFCPQNCEKCLI